MAPRIKKAPEAEAAPVVKEAEKAALPAELTIGFGSEDLNKLAATVNEIIRFLDK